MLLIHTAFQVNDLPSWKDTLRAVPADAPSNAPAHWHTLPPAQFLNRLRALPWVPSYPPFQVLYNTMLPASHSFVPGVATLVVLTIFFGTKVRPKRIGA